MRTLLLIDANSLIHRAFHALPPLTTPDGRPAGALYGLSSILLKVFREEPPEFAAACFDRPEPTFREKAYADYKAHRPPTPPALVPQLHEAHALFRAFGVRVFEHAGMEADDLIATLVERFKGEPDTRVVILTGDRDTLQLVADDKVVVRMPRRGVSETTTYDGEAVRETFGVTPAQMADYKALVGDPSDNIKGVPGVGPRTATELLQRYGSVRGIYDHLDGEPRLRDRLSGTRKLAEAALLLVTLVRDAPIGSPSLVQLATTFRSENVRAHFASLGFSSLVKRAEENGRTKSSKQKTAPRAGPHSVQGTMF